MRLTDIKGFNKRGFDGIVAVANTILVSTAKKTQNVPYFQTRSDGAAVYIIWKTIEKKHSGYGTQNHVKCKRKKPIKTWTGRTETGYSHW